SAVLPGQMMSEPTKKSDPVDSTRVSAVQGQPLVLGPPVATPAVAPPTRLGEFEILGKLGEGAFGQVFLARQVSLGREVALKVTHPGMSDSEVLSGIASLVPEVGRNEGQLLASLEHDHIVKVFSEFVDPGSGSRGLCLQYVPGADLGKIIRQI